MFPRSGSTRCKAYDHQWGRKHNSEYGNRLRQTATALPLFYCGDNGRSEHYKQGWEKRAAADNALAPSPVFAGLSGVAIGLWGGQGSIFSFFFCFFSLGRRLSVYIFAALALLTILIFFLFSFSLLLRMDRAAGAYREEHRERESQSNSKSI